MIDSIHVTNFRSFEDFELRLGEPLVALVGKNGVGKTNILHAISTVAEFALNAESHSRFFIRPQSPENPAILRIDFHLGAQHFHYQSAVDGSFRDHRSIREHLFVNGKPFFSRARAELDLLIGPKVGRAQRFQIGHSASGIPALQTILPVDDPARETLRVVAEFLESVRYYPLIQRPNEHHAPASRSDSGLDSTVYIDSAAYESWKSDLVAGRRSRSIQMRLLHLWKEQDDRFQELISLLGDDGLGLISNIAVEEFRIGPRPIGSGDTGEDKRVTTYVVYFYPGEALAGAGRAFTLTGLSSGTWRIVQLLTHLIFDKSSCMLVEQPEDMVHRGLLEQVVDILGSYSHETQVVCATHSAKVMQKVGPKGIRIVEADHGRTRVRELTPEDQSLAHEYIKDEGDLADFLDTL